MASGGSQGAKHANVVSAGDELLRERLDVPVDPSLIGPGIGGDERDAHRARVPRLLAVISGGSHTSLNYPAGLRALRGLLRIPAWASVPRRRPERRPGRAPRASGRWRRSRSRAHPLPPPRRRRSGLHARMELAAARRRSGATATPQGQHRRSRSRRGGWLPPGRSRARRARVGAGRRRPGRPLRLRRAPNASGERCRRKRGQSRQGRPEQGKGWRSGPRPGRRRPVVSFEGSWVPGCAKASRFARSSEAAATAAPTGSTIAAPTSAPKRPAPKTMEATTPAERKAPIARLPGHPLAPAAVSAEARPGGHGDHHREQRLELVADPVEADAEDRVRAEQGELGQR